MVELAEDPNLLTPLARHRKSSPSVPQRSGARASTSKSPKCVQIVPQTSELMCMDCNMKIAQGEM